MSTRISRSLRLLATAQRVSMEDADKTVQGQEGALSDEELAKVAKAGADSVDANADTDTPADDTTSTDTIPSNDTQSDTPADGAGDDSAPSGTADTDAVIPTGDVANADATTDASPAEDEVSADDIQTPAEKELEETEGTDGEATADSSDATDPAAADEDASTDTPPPPIGDDATAEGDAAADATTDDSAAAASSDDPMAGTDSDALMDVGTDPGVDPTAAHDEDAGAAAVDTSVGSDDATGTTAADTDNTLTDTNVIAADAENDAGSSENVAGADAENEEPQAQAPAPGPQTDASEAVQEVVQLTEALASAQSAEEVVKEAHDSSEELGEIANTAEFSNEQGGVTMEGLASLKLAIHPYASRLGHRHINLGVTLESFRGKSLTHRHVVSLEDVNAMIEELDLAQPQLERQRIETLDRVVQALKSALPTAAKRLKAVLSTAANSNADKEGATIDVSDGLAAALSIDGALPSDLSDQLQNYAQLGRMLLGPYAEASYRAAKSASLLNNAVNFSSTSVFWEKIGDVVQTVVDPRTTLTRTQLESGLPGGTCLFDQAVPPLEATNKVLQMLFDYNGSYAPLTTALVTKGGGDTTGPALSSAKIVLVGNALLEVLNEDRISERLDEGQKLWPEAQDALRHLNENLDGAPPEIESEAGTDFSQVIKFVETNYSLATWPLVNYLTNLVLTVNAFVLYAERSLKAESVPANDTSFTETTDPVLEETDSKDDVPNPVDADVETKDDNLVSSEKPDGEIATDNKDK